MIAVGNIGIMANEISYKYTQMTGVEKVATLPKSKWLLWPDGEMSSSTLKDDSEFVVVGSIVVVLAQGEKRTKILTPDGRVGYVSKEAVWKLPHENRSISTNR